MCEPKTEPEASGGFPFCFWLTHRFPTQNWGDTKLDRAARILDSVASAHTSTGLSMSGGRRSVPDRFNASRFGSYFACELTMSRYF